MEDKNKEKDQKSKKKHKWLGIFLIALLILFIALTGYYLERDLEPVPDNQITENGAADNSDENSAADNNLQESDSSSEDDNAENGSDTTAENGSEKTVENESDTTAENGSDTTAENGSDTTAENGSDTTAENGSDTTVETEKEEFGEENTAENGQTSSADEGDGGETAAEDQNDITQELEEDSGLLDRILSILGLSESDFAQDLNILFVGLDDEESVAFGTIEADSVMLARLRPEADKLQLEHIDEDREYKGQELRKYYNGDIQLAVEDITETEIDYYVYVNYQGFEKVIDELGGVKINLNEAVRVPDLGLNLKAGDNLLSGKEALNFVRWRDSDSMTRFQRQKILINAVMAKLKSNNILFNVKDLYNTLVESYNSIETDINPVLAAEIFSYIRDNDDLELEFID
ncbi:MAG: LCP family protein [Halanaerobium sp.]